MNVRPCTRVAAAQGLAWCRCLLLAWVADCLNLALSCLADATCISDGLTASVQPPLRVSTVRWFTQRRRHCSQGKRHVSMGTGWLEQPCSAAAASPTEQ
jgi:hypothetical protein